MVGLSTDTKGLGTDPSQKQSRPVILPKVGIPTLSTVTHTFSRPVNTTGSFSTAPGSAMGLNLPGSRPPVFRWLGYLPTFLKDWAQTHPKNNPDPIY
jgi:hypothetical protein